jgi:Spy/CpxP family protein refolding chaperone
MGMMGMGSMGGGKGMKMKTTAALPGFPGASHVYHIGATGFFLDHPEHITLTTEQQSGLNRAKQKALLDRSKSQRKIEEAEQELWELTGADQPDVAQIQAKVQEIEKLRGEQRLAFIRAVGEAAKVLTEDQRKALLGTAKPQGHKAHAP